MLFRRLMRCRSRNTPLRQQRASLLEAGHSPSKSSTWPQITIYRMAARMLEILEYLKGSFAALHRSAATVTADNAVAPVLPERVGTARQNTRVQFAVDAVA